MVESAAQHQPRTSISETSNHLSGGHHRGKHARSQSCRGTQRWRLRANDWTTSSRPSSRSPLLALALLFLCVLQAASAASAGEDEVSADEIPAGGAVNDSVATTTTTRVSPGTTTTAASRVAIVQLSLSDVDWFLSNSTAKQILLTAFIAAFDVSESDVAVAGLEAVSSRRLSYSEPRLPSAFRATTRRLTAGGLRVEYTISSASVALDGDFEDIATAYRESLAASLTSLGLQQDTLCIEKLCLDGTCTINQVCGTSQASSTEEEFANEIQRFVHENFLPWGVIIIGALLGLCILYYILSCCRRHAPSSGKDDRDSIRCGALRFKDTDPDLRDPPLFPAPKELPPAVQSKPDPGPPAASAAAPPTTQPAQDIPAPVVSSFAAHDAGEKVGAHLPLSAFVEPTMPGKTEVDGAGLGLGNENSFEIGNLDKASSMQSDDSFGAESMFGGLDDKGGGRLLQRPSQKGGVVKKQVDAESFTGVITRPSKSTTLGAPPLYGGNDHNIQHHQYVPDVHSFRDPTHSNNSNINNNNAPSQSRGLSAGAGVGPMKGGAPLEKFEGADDSDGIPPIDPDSRPVDVLAQLEGPRPAVHQHQPQGVLPPTIPPEEVVRWARMVYARYNPKRLDYVEVMVRQNKGRERELVRAICEKYRLHPSHFENHYARSSFDPSCVSCGAWPLNFAASCAPPPRDPLPLDGPGSLTPLPTASAPGAHSANATPRAPGPGLHAHAHAHAPAAPGQAPLPALFQTAPTTSALPSSAASVSSTSSTATSTPTPGAAAVAAASNAAAGGHPSSIPEDGVLLSNATNSSVPPLQLGGF